ncbi:transposase [Thermodesulfobacteriota bacterium]
MKYLRSRTKGATFFFTVVTYKRNKILCDNENSEIIKEAFKHIASKRPFKTDAFVMLPDHIHCIWTLPYDDSNFSVRWSLIKEYFTKRCNESIKHEQTDSMKKKGLQGVWQKRFWEHTIRDEKDFAAHVDYIHYNPVKHGFSEAPKDWPYSTFHRYVKEGIYDVNWGAYDKVTFDETVGNE